MKPTKSHEDLLDEVEAYIKDNLPELQKKLDEKAFEMDCEAQLNYLPFDWHTSFIVLFIDEYNEVRLHKKIQVKHADYLDFKTEILTKIT